MDSNQDFGSILNSFSGSSPTGPKQDSGDGFGSLLNGLEAARSRPTRQPVPVDPEAFRALAVQEGADHLLPVIGAIYGQESGAGTNARTSTDGARGGMQIMPDTFRRYAKPGERIDNPEDNMRVGVRIIKDLGAKFGNDPAKIATGYFSGEGNVNAGQGSAWKNDAADGNGKRVSGYVSDVLNRVGVAPTQQQTADLSKAPKWADVEAKAEFKALPPEKQAEAKAAYFDYWIAPRAGDRGAELRQKFLEASQATPTERTWGEVGSDTLVQLAEGVNTIFGAVPNLVAPESGAAEFFNSNAQSWRDKQSKPLLDRMANADKAITKAGDDGVIAQITEAASQYFSDPALAARFVTTNLPSMIPGIGAAKVAQAAAIAKGASAAKAASVATTAAGGVNAVLNAGGARGEAFEDIKRTMIEQGMSPQEAEQRAIEDSRVVAAVGGAAGFLSGKIGLEKALVGGAGKGGARAGVGAFAKELAGEQIEEVAPKVTTNYQAGQYDNRSIGKDVGRTIVETGIGSGPGAVLAGGVEALSRGTPADVSTTPDGRVEPTMGGDQAVAPAKPAEPAVNQTAPQQSTTEPESVSNQDVQDFAANRFQQLREKRDGKIESVVGESGVVDQDMPGVGLSPTEQQELASIERANNDPKALRTLYGFDQPTIEENQNVETEQQAKGTGPALDQSPIAEGGQPAAVQEPAAQATGTEVGTEVGQQLEGLPAQDAITDSDIPDIGAPSNVSEEDAMRSMGFSEQEIADATQAKQPQPAPPVEPPKPKTEKEAKARRIADADNGIVEHTTKKGKVLRGKVFQGMTLDEAKQYDQYAFKKDGGVFVREEHLPNIPQQPQEQQSEPQADQAQQAEAQQQEAPAAEPAVSSDEQVPAEASTAPTAEGGLPDAGTTGQPVEANGVGEAWPGLSKVADKPKTEREAKAQREQVTEPQRGTTDRVDGNQRNSAPMQELGGFKVGDSGLKVKGRTVKSVTIESLFTRNLPGFDTPSNIARVRTESGGVNDVLVETLERAAPDVPQNGEKVDTSQEPVQKSPEIEQVKPKTEKEARAKRESSVAPQVEENSTEPVAEPVKQEENSTHASPVQTESVSDGTESQAPEDAAVGNRDSQPVGAGVAEQGEGADRSEPVPASTGEPGAAGARDSEQSGSEPSGQTRDSAGVRPESGTTDHVIDAEEIGKGGLTKKYRDNVAAIRLLKTLESEGRVATPEERKALAKYVGWGAMKGPFDPANKQWAKQHAELKELLTDAEFRAARKSTLDAHYTSPVAIGAMNAALERIGYRGGRMLEPSVGIGNFYGLMPAAVRNASQLYGVELDSLTSRMVAALYPKAKIAKATGFEDFDIPGEFFDLVQGNPPFGSQPLVDKERSAYSGFSIHNYFLAKGIDKLRPGGIMQVVVSHNFLDAQDDRARKWIGERATLIGAVRMPNTAFKENAGTEVVTDILIFQKNDPSAIQHEDAGQWQAVVDQVNVNPKTGESVTHKVNQFFVANPQNILGKPSAGGTQYSANEYTVEATGDLKKQLAGWVDSLPDGVYQHIDRKADSAVVDMAVPDGIKTGSFYVDASGRVMQRGQDVMGDKTANEWTPKNETAAKRMKGMIELRDALRTQMRLERSLDATEADIEANRGTLNTLYDDFLKKFGHLNSQTNRSIFMDDTESQLLQALEFDYDKGISKAVAESEGIEERKPSAVKADILKRRVAFPPQDFLTVSTGKDALLASLNYRGKVDSAYMEEVYGKPMDEIVKELGDVVYDDPQSGIVTADEYLSGDVKTKLAEAKAAAQDDAKYKRNVAALEKVIPKDKKPSEISVSIGAAFVPRELYEQFVKKISGGNATAAYIRATGQWVMAYHGQTDQALNTGKYGTSDLSAQDLFQLTMLGRGAVVKKTFRNPDGSSTTVLLEKETEAAREKQNAIKAEWQKWLWEDATRADNMAALYNDKMNRIVERKYDGQHLSFPGMNPAIQLLEHQKNGVWRGLQSYQVLYDHVVGAGKTFEMATLAMEMRRLGISRKPLFIVPNHLTLQWRSEFTRLYPGSNILAATPEDFAKDKRERMFSKIITGDWDAVVIGHSSLKKIGLPEETEKAVLQEQIDEVAQAIEDMKRGRGDRNIIRDMEGIRARLEAKMKDKLAAIGTRSKVVTFDELGIDAMFIDEMHEFKNLSYNSTMDRNPGMGNPNGSGKAFDLFVKTRWMFDTFGEKTPYISATGTPVSNSLVEMFNMQRYMQYPTLKKEGLHVFDAWAKQFGSVENVYEVAPSGSGYRQSTRFAKFTNLPGLMGLFNTFADTITLDDLRAQEEAQGKRFPVPKMVGGKPQLFVAKRSPAVAALMGVPKAETLEDGSIRFDADLNGDISITQDEKTGKWNAKVGDAHIGQFETEQDARLKIVEKALSPKVSVAPESILGRFANLKQLTKESKGKVNALSLTGEANKAGLDYRLIDPHAADFPGSKINMAVDNAMKVYHQWAADKGTQLIFCDMSIPLSARSSYSSKERRLYVRGENGAVEMKRGTMHTVAGFESLPFFIVQKGQKEAKRFEVFDAASGVLIGSQATKAEAKESAAALLADAAKRQRWIDRRESAGEISQEQIDDFNNDNEVDTEVSEAFSREDIAGISGNAAFSVYDDIKAKLIAKGVPEREIAFIHDYSTPVAKDKLFKAVNSGEIRFLLGSTPKMGAGTNVQKRLVGLHHIDAPWRPSDLEQREGRIIRRGNDLYERNPEGFEVFIGRYATEQTYDTRRWQILEHKARGIEQLRNFDGTINEIDDIEGEAANSADMKAAASGDPMILEETKLRNDVRRLEQLQAGHADEVLAMTRKAKDAEQYAEKYGPRTLDEISGLIGKAKKHPLDKEGFAPVTVDGKTFKDKESAGEAIAKATSVVRAGMEEELVVKYRGLEFTFTSRGGALVADSPTGNVGAWAGAEPFSGTGFVQRMKNYVDRLPAAQEDTKAQIEKARKDIVALREQAKQPFAQAKELEAAREEYKKVQRALLAKGPDVPDNQKAAVAAGIQAQKAKLEKLGYGEALREFFAGNDGDIKFQAGEDYTGQPKSNPTENDLKNVRSLNRGVVRYLRDNGQAVDDGVLGYVVGDVRGNEAIRSVAKSFGQNLQWFVLAPGLTDQQRKQFGFFNGAVTGGVTYLNAETDRPHLAVLGHEVVHQLRKDNPDLYDEFVDLVRPYIKPALYKAWAETSKVASTAKTQDGKHEEFMAEIGSDAFMEPSFWDRIGQANPTLLGKLVEIAKSLVDLAKSALGQSKKTESILRDYDAVMRITSDVMGRYLGGKAGVAGEGIQFNMRDTVAKVQRDALQFFGNRTQDQKSLQTFGLYHKTLSTQYNKALKDKHFGKVFAYVNAMQNEVSLTSIRPAELAPGVLPRVDDVKAAAKQLVRGKKSDNNLEQAATAIFDGTLDGESVMQGKVWSESELRARGLNDTGIALYKQSRAAIDASLDEVAAAEAYAMAQGVIPKTMRREIIDNPRQAEAMVLGEFAKQIKMLDRAIKAAAKMGAVEQEAELKAARTSYLNTNRQVEKIFVTAKNLKQAGYAPLMRFGKYTVTVQLTDPNTGAVARDENGEALTLFYGQFETEGEAKAVRREMENRYKERDDVTVRAGTKSQSSHELYAGISPETLALFAEAIGADNAMRKYIELAMTERSALKRRLERKGTQGYSEDLPRVLSNFITSNGRHAAQRYYLRDLNNAIKYIPKEKGDVLDEAIRLKGYVLNPNDPAAPLSSVMFAWFLGGSVAAAVVNLTQPVMMTAPYLSQFGAGKATKALAMAMPYAMGRKEITDNDLREAIKRASQEGIVDAQEIFHLYSVGAQGVASGLVNQLAKLPGVGGKIKAGSEDARARINAFLTLWGSMFAVAEGFNRKLTFIAAWDVAKANKEKNPYAFAVRAVNETQGIYNKVNRPNWAQGPVGRTLLTFKQFSIMYVELLSRMWKRGGPEGKRAALIMLAVLMLASGEEGLPFAQDLDDLIDTVGQMFGLDTNMKRNKRRVAHEILGKGLGDMFLYGLSPYLPLDFAGRLGLGNLIPGTGLLKPSDSEIRGRQVAEIFGPTAGMATQIGDAYDAVAEGNTGKAVQNLAPKAVKDALASAEMVKKGYATDAKGRKVVDVGLGDAAIKAVGFQPTVVAQKTRKTMPVQQDIALQKKTESSIVNQWVRALADNDTEMAKEAQQRLTEWNRKNPGTPIQITPDQIRNLARQMVTDKDTRLLKSAPREMRGRIGLDLAK